MRANNTDTEYYLYDREDRIGDYDENGNLMIAYTHGPATDEPVAMTINGSTYFYIPDIQGSIRAIVDIDGNMMASYVYDVWGKLVSHSGVLAEKNDYLYTGREYDWETGIYYYRYRYYNPEIGRFLQSSWELNEEMNMYVYVNNDPVKGVDPTGHPYRPHILGEYTPPTYVIPSHFNCEDYCNNMCIDIAYIICAFGIGAAYGSAGSYGALGLGILRVLTHLPVCLFGPCLSCATIGLCNGSSTSTSTSTSLHNMRYSPRIDIR